MIHQCPVLCFPLAMYNVVEFRKGLRQVRSVKRDKNDKNDRSRLIKIKPVGYLPLVPETHVSSV
jgi:hypothetical protein